MKSTPKPPFMHPAASGKKDSIQTFAAFCTNVRDARKLPLAACSINGGRAGLYSPWQRSGFFVTQLTNQLLCCGAARRCGHSSALQQFHWLECRFADLPREAKPTRPSPKRSKPALAGNGTVAVFATKEPSTDATQNPSLLKKCRLDFYLRHKNC